MNNRSKKQKGANFEKFCLELLKQLDPKAYRIFSSGSGLQKGDLYAPNLQWIIECKNHRHLSIVEWLAQNKRQENDYNISLLMFKNPKSPDINPEAVICLTFEHLCKLIAGTGKTSINANSSPTDPDKKELKYLIDNWLTLGRKIVKKLEN